MMKRCWQIYTLSDPRTQQVRYVGMTFRGKQRFNEHISRAITGGNTHRDCWIRSLIALNLRPDYRVIEEGRDLGWQDAERRWIATHRKSCDLTNHTDGGDGTPGAIPSPQLRLKWSAMRTGVPYAPGRVPAMKGKHHTPEAIEKLRAASTGRVMPDSMRVKISAARKGKSLSPEHVEKLAARKRGVSLAPEHKAKIAASTTTRKPVLCVETCEIYPSVKAVMRALSAPHASVYQAIRKHYRCKGFHFRFL